ncbi:MAG: DNA-directed RNA polymerase subunit L [Candidatus Diapherotrites archaeon]|nr:DNA-directed RNA polymerase subunit L [Candidatus Diapherotrites archaeon]
MEMNILKDDKDELVFELKGEQHTYPALLCWALLNDPKVRVAVYDAGHPLIGKSCIRIKTSGKSPKKALESAVSLLGSEFSGLERASSKK